MCSKPWYINTPVGVNTLKAILPKMSEMAGTSSRYTNHSLRATATTRLYHAEVSEKIIQDTSGHRSLYGSRVYERTTTEQEKNVMKIIASVDTNIEGSNEEQHCEKKIAIDQGKENEKNMSNEKYKLSSPSLEKLKCMLEDISYMCGISFDDVIEEVGRCPGMEVGEAVQFSH